MPHDYHQTDNHSDPLSHETWEAAKTHHFVRGPLTQEEAGEQAYKVVRMAMFGFAKSYGNRIRKKENKPPIPAAVHLPVAVSNWIESQLEAVDSFSGHMGAKTYQTLANAFLAQLRAAEQHFLNHKVEHRG